MLTEWCFEVHWQLSPQGPVLPWRKAPALAVHPPSATSLLAHYEQAQKLLDQGQDQASMEAFQSGLTEFLALERADATQNVLGRALLWGTARGLERLGKSEAAWEMLKEVIRGTSAGSPVPLDLLLQWLESSLSLALRLEYWGEAVALLNLLLELFGQAHIGQGTEVGQFLRQTWYRLEPRRVEVYQALVEAEEFEAAEAVCRDLLERIEAGHYPDPEAREVWSAWLEAALQREVSAAVGAGSEPIGEPSLKMAWRTQNGHLQLEWSLGHQDPGRADTAPDWAEFARVSRLQESGNLVQSLACCNQVLARLESKGQLQAGERTLRWMFLWARGATLDLMSSQEPPLASGQQAWEALHQFVDVDASQPRSLLLVLTWARSYLMVSCSQGRWDGFWEVLDLLWNLSVHPQVRALPELREAILQRFLRWLQDSYEWLSGQADPGQRLSWARQAMERFEPPGSVFLPVREMLWRSLKDSDLTSEASRLAQEVATWAGQNQAPEVAAEWHQRT